MSRGKKKPERSETGQPEPMPFDSAGAASQPASAGADPGPAPGPAPGPELPPQEEAAPQPEEQAAALKDRLLRKAAEFENYQKRIAKEIDEVRKYAIKPFALDLLAALDNMERALAAAGDAAPGGGAASVLVEGVRMVYEQIQTALASHGVTPIEALDRPFDPNLHDAVMEEENADLPDRTVIDVLLRGYMLHDRLLRPARVRVSRRPQPEAPGGAGPEKAPPESDGPADGPDPRKQE